MVTFVSIGLGMIGLLLLLASGTRAGSGGIAALGLVLLLASALLFVSGHRRQRDRREDEWRRQMLDQTRRDGK